MDTVHSVGGGGGVNLCVLVCMHALISSPCELLYVRFEALRSTINLQGSNVQTKSYKHDLGNMPPYHFLLIPHISVLSSASVCNTLAVSSSAETLDVSCVSVNLNTPSLVSNYVSL